MTKHDKKLWERVAYWRGRLKECEDYPVLEGLETAWKAAHGEDVEQGYYPRDDQPADNPVTAIMYCIDMGFYPTPELMLTMLDCFEQYKTGVCDLETAFFGKPLQKAGKYNQREGQKFRDMIIKFRFSELLSAGETRAKAAEQIALEMETHPRFIGYKPIDADSILRMLRGFDGWNASKSKAEK